MNISTFDESCHELKEFATRFEKFIDTEHDFVEGGLVVSLNSKFGSGKSTFLKMWRNSLESKPENENKWMVISLNAWESDYSGEPLFSIISTLAESLERNGEKTHELVEAAKDIGWVITTIGSQVVNKITGVDVIAAGDIAEKKKSSRNSNIEVTDAFSIFQKRKKAMDSLKKTISEIVSSDSPKILFLVDELDRCRPDYAITYLETIKHLFDTKGAVFILAADRKQLENSAMTAFGSELDFDEYYRKFVHREVNLPPIPQDGYRKLAKQYINFYLTREGLRLCFMKLDNERLNDMAEIIGALKLTPRQLQEVFRILGHLLSTTKENEGRLYPFIGIGCVFFAALKLGNSRIYHLLGTNNLEPVEAVTLLQTMSPSSIDWWFAFIYSGGGLKISKDETFESVLLRSKLNSQRTMNPSDFHQGWGHSNFRFEIIYQNIELITQFR